MIAFICHVRVIMDTHLFFSVIATEKELQQLSNAVNFTCPAAGRNLSSMRGSSQPAVTTVAEAAACNAVAACQCPADIAHTAMAAEVGSASACCSAGCLFTMIILTTSTSAFNVFHCSSSAAATSAEAQHRCCCYCRSSN